MHKSQPDNWWHRLGGPNAITMPAWLLTLPGAMLTPVVSAGSPTLAQLPQWTAIGLLGHLVMGVVMLIGRGTVLSARPRPSRPWTFVVVVSIAGLCRGFVVAETAYAWGITDTPELAFRLISAPGTVLLWFSLATLIVDGMRRHRRAMALLRRQLARERRMADESARLIRDFRAEIVADTQRTVAEQLAHATALSDDPDAAARRLRLVVDDVVRPLSHELELRTVLEDELLHDATQAADRARMPTRDYLVATLSARPFNPLLVSVLVMGTSVYVIISNLGFVAGLIGLAFSGLFVGLANRLARTALARCLGKVAVRRRVVLVVLTWLAIACADALIVVGYMEGRSAWPPGFGPGMRLGVFVTCLVVALLAQATAAADGAVAVQRKRAEDDLRDAAAAMEWTSSRLRQQAFLEQRQLGRVLHGDVQARIVSMALQIQLNPPADPQAAIAALADQVSQALDDRREVDWREELAEVIDLWADAIDLGVDVDPGAAIVLDADPSAARSLVEVLREAVTNAVRHGQADTVCVRVTPAVEAIEVTVADDGSGLVGAAVKGMGSRMLDAVCLSWELAGRPAVLHARIASSADSRQEVFV